MTGLNRTLIAAAIIFSMHFAIGQTGGLDPHRATPSADKDVLWEFDTGG